MFFLHKIINILLILAMISLLVWTLTPLSVHPTMTFIPNTDFDVSEGFVTAISWTHKRVPNHLKPKRG